MQNACTVDSLSNSTQFLRFKPAELLSVCIRHIPLWCNDISFWSLRSGSFTNKYDCDYLINWVEHTPFPTSPTTYIHPTTCSTHIPSASSWRFTTTYYPTYYNSWEPVSSHRTEVKYWPNNNHTIYQYTINTTTKANLPITYIYIYILYTFILDTAMYLPC